MKFFFISLAASLLLCTPTFAVIDMLAGKYRHGSDFSTDLDKDYLLVSEEPFWLFGTEPPLPIDYSQQLSFFSKQQCNSLKKEPGKVRASFVVVDWKKVISDFRRWDVNGKKEPFFVPVHLALTDFECSETHFQIVKPQGEKSSVSTRKASNQEKKQVSFILGSEGDSQQNKNLIPKKDGSLLKTMILKKNLEVKSLQTKIASDPTNLALQKLLNSSFVLWFSLNEFYKQLNCEPLAEFAHSLNAMLNYVDSTLGTPDYNAVNYQFVRQRFSEADLTFKAPNDNETEEEPIEAPIEP